MQGPTAPVVLLLSPLISFYNLWLLKHEGIQHFRSSCVNNLLADAFNTIFNLSFMYIFVVWPCCFLEF